MALHVFGIRHHGPGCARALRSALEKLEPDALLVEGPPDATEVLPLLANSGMVPPVALLVHAVEDPKRCSFYPFAEFSPEWQALRFAFERQIPARFMDLPCAHRLVEQATRDEPEGTDPGAAEAEEEGLREDPIGLLAEAAGFADREQWWDVQVEQRKDATGLFQGILEAMGILRERHEETRLVELQREAHMRNAIRAAQNEGFERIALVCGAWHAPKLAELGSAKQDAALLKGLGKTKVSATWIPWTHSRLSFRSGYGAGVESPGWYAHVWRHLDDAPVVWATLAARLLREQDLDASAASVIETVRLATTIAALRELPSPGLGELREAILATLCGGERARLVLIREHLEIGSLLGEVPEQAGQVPLMRDFESEAKRLRLKLSTAQTPLELDLRKPNDREKSQLLHRLNVLRIGWGQLQPGSKGTGTFRESWRLCWSPELAVELIAANIFGNTLETAAHGSLCERAKQAQLSELTALVEVGILSALPAALDVLLEALDARAATSSDVRVQMEALAPLARVARYGDVRETRSEHVLPVLMALFERVVVGLLSACTQLDDDAAASMLEAVDKAHGACMLLDQAALRSDWLGALRQLMESEVVQPRIAGRACRILLDQKSLESGELARRASLALSSGVESSQAARWIEGLVAGDGLLLVHQEELVATLDAWLSQLSDETFQAQLPLLRRAFSSLQAGERRAVAQRLKAAGPNGQRKARRVPEAEPLDRTRAARVVPILAHILGVHHD